MKKPKFRQRICVKFEMSDVPFEMVIGDPDHVNELDAENGETVAIYVLDHVVQYQTNPLLKLKG